MKIHLRPKTKMAETIKNSHFRRRKRKRKRISVGLYIRSRPAAGVSWLSPINCQKLIATFCISGH